MDKIIRLKIDSATHGKTVKDILLSNMGLSAGVIRGLKQIPHSIMLNNEAVYVTKTVSLNDMLTVSIKDKQSPNIVPSEIPLDILYEDEEIIALNKPREMPTHPSHNHHNDTLANGLVNYFKDKTFTFRAITRLDRDTSGIVLVAKNSLSAQILGEDIKNKKIEKEYIAVINGQPSDDNGIISAPIKRAKEGIILRCVAPDGKEAVTEYKVLKKINGFTLISLIPITGRTHQLRVHLSHIGNPIYGDDLYGAPQKNEKTRLHCKKLIFNHPVTKKKIEIEAPIPDDILNLIL